MASEQTSNLRDLTSKISQIWKDEGGHVEAAKLLGGQPDSLVVVPCRITFSKSKQFVELKSNDGKYLYTVTNPDPGYNPSFFTTYGTVVFALGFKPGVYSWESAIDKGDKGEDCYLVLAGGAVVGGAVYRSGSVSTRYADTGSGEGEWKQSSLSLAELGDLHPPSTHCLVRDLHALDVPHDQFHEAILDLFAEAIFGPDGPGAKGFGEAPQSMGSVNKVDGTSNNIMAVGVGQLKIRDPVSAVPWSNGIILQANTLKKGNYPCILVNNPQAGFVIFVIGTTDSRQCAFGYYRPGGEVPPPDKDHPVQYYPQAEWTLV